MRKFSFQIDLSYVYFGTFCDGVVGVGGDRFDISLCLRSFLCANKHTHTRPIFAFIGIDFGVEQRRKWSSGLIPTDSVKVIAVILEANR